MELSEAEKERITTELDHIEKQIGFARACLVSLNSRYVLSYVVPIELAADNIFDILKQSEH